MANSEKEIDNYFTKKAKLERMIKFTKNENILEVYFQKKKTGHDLILYTF